MRGIVGWASLCLCRGGLVVFAVLGGFAWRRCVDRQRSCPADDRFAQVGEALGRILRYFGELFLSLRINRLALYKSDVGKARITRASYLFDHIAEEATNLHAPRAG